MTTMLQTPRGLADLVRDRAEGARSSETVREAIDAIGAAGFPSARHEQWRYFPTAPILDPTWQPAAEADAGATDVTGTPAFESAHVTIVNGRLKNLPALPAGVSIETIDSSSDYPAEVGTTYASSAHPFAALNLVLAPGVIVIRVAPDAGIDLPIHLDFHSVPGDTPTIVTPRVLVVVERGARISLIETWSGEGALLVVPVIELLAAAGSIVDHTRLVLEGPATIHVANHRARLERDAVLRSYLVSIGGGRVRNEIAVALEGEGSEASLDGLWMLIGDQRADQHTTLDHVSPHTTSRELYKGVLGDRSNGIFEGLVIVRPDAQKISSQQTNNNLLLSTRAIADSKPQLEIHADDVRCAHGSTIGQLDEGSLFYLQSRGIGIDEARRMLTLAFAGEMVDRLPVESLREPLRAAIAQRVPLMELTR